jgi:hypothetical protein
MSILLLALHGLAFIWVLWVDFARYALNGTMSVFLPIAYVPLPFSFGTHQGNELQTVFAGALSVLSRRSSLELVMDLTPETRED